MLIRIMSYSRLVRPEFQCFLTSPYYLYAPVLKFIQGNLKSIVPCVKSRATGAPANLEFGLTKFVQLC